MNVMVRIKREGKLLAVILLLSSTLPAQTGSNHTVSTAFAVLTKSVDCKGATTGLEITLRTITDVVVDGDVVIPRDSRLSGHVAGVATKGKEQSQSRLALVIDKAINGSGREIPLQAIIAAIAAPQDTSLTSDPTYGMMHSNEPKMVGANTAGTASTGSLPPSSRAASNAAVATAELKGVRDDSLLLNENSQGAIGYDGLTITWQFTLPPPVTVFSTKSNNLKLTAGTQMLLRMVPPRLPH